MRILVTGGAGFIGSHLVQGLVATGGYEVVVLDNLTCGNKLDAATLAGVSLIDGDVRDKATVAGAMRGCRRVFHMAAIVGVDVVARQPVATMETEVAGLNNVVQAAIANGCERIVYASSSDVYGEVSKAVDEDSAVSPRSTYSVAKRFNEVFLRAAHDEHGLSSVSLRYFNIYGPGQDERMVIPRFLKQAKEGRPLTVFGTGGQTRDFTYIDDAIGATILCANAVAGCEIVNVCHNREHTIKSVAEAVVRACGSSSPLQFLDADQGRQDFEVSRRIGSAAKLVKLTGFSPETTLEQGLARILGCARSK